MDSRTISSFEDGKSVDDFKDGLTTAEVDELYMYNKAAREIAEFELDEHGSLSADRRDMQRMGKQQELRRTFRQISLLSFTCICMSTWEWILLANKQGLTSGGSAGLFWSYVWACAGFGFISASVAEMSSMSPSNGGQYHWTSEFAPPRYQKILSYITGWLSVLAMQASNISGLFVAGGQVQSLICVYFPHYNRADWHMVLLIVPGLCLIMAACIFGNRAFGILQNTSMVLHVLMWVAILDILWVLAPHVPARQALLKLTNHGGWSSTGLAVMVGQINMQCAISGPETAIFMAEEVRDAAITVPKAIMNSYMLSGVMGLAMVATFVLSLPHPQLVLKESAGGGGAFRWILEQSMPRSGVAAIICIMITLILLGNISYSAATARLTFAFARDKGLPLSTWIGEVDRKLLMPVNAVLFTGALCMLVSLTYLSSSSAFNAIISLANASLMASYGISISCILHRRITAPHTLPEARWSLGSSGVFVNIVAIAYSWTVFFWSFWPNTMMVNVQSFNYAPVMFVGVCVIAVLTYVFGKNQIYHGPVSTTKLNTS